MPLEIIAPDGYRILSLSDWENHAPPKQSIQWKCGRSAMELAKAWTRVKPPAVPAEMDMILNSRCRTSGLAIEKAFPEAKTRLDDLPGEPRNSDLMVVAKSGSGLAVIEVEAKVDEVFGEYVDEYLAKAVHDNPRSKVPERLNHLVPSLLGSSHIPSGTHLRYQLIHATAAALIEAGNRGSSLAVLVVHEFMTLLYDTVRASGNHADFDAFIRSLPGCSGLSAVPGTLIGPVSVPGGPHVPEGIDLYIGRIETVVCSTGKERDYPEESE